jgi:hypothetical protein
MPETQEKNFLNLRSRHRNLWEAAAECGLAAESE